MRYEQLAKDPRPGSGRPVTYWVGPTTGAVLHIPHIQLNSDDESLIETDID
jgi:hypothetical protein